MLSSLPQSAQAIATYIPHQGSMCLLERVEQCDSQRIVCRTGSHRSPHNPLRHAEQLGVAAGIEYAAQAMALHAALQAPSTERAQAGYLTSVRGVTMHAMRLDTYPQDLRVEAECVALSDSAAMYQFAVYADTTCVLEGKMSAVLRVEV